MAGKPTLVSLARDLGVSRQTVSNAINAPHRVNAGTLARVRKAIADSGYRPHVAGRQLRTRRSRNLAMRLHPSSDGINGSILDRFLHALTGQAQRHGYRLTLFTAADDDDELAAIDELLSTADIDGFVVTSTHHDDARTAWLLEESVPFVCFGRPWSATRDPFGAAHAWVDVDGSVGTAQATSLLLGRGYTRVGFLGWPEGSGVGDDRRAGWWRTLQAGGIEVAPDELSLGVEDTVAAGAGGARELIRRGATAVVCASDSLALGALAAWRGADLPDDGAGPPIVGFDDTPVAAAVGLSSVHQPVEEIAGHVLTGLLAQLEDDTDGAHPSAGGATEEAGNGGPHRHRLLAPRLVVRQPDPQLTG